MVKENPKKVPVVPTIISEGYLIVCKFNLLHPGDYFTLLLVSLEKQSSPTIISYIENSPKIISSMKFSSRDIKTLVFLFCVVPMSSVFVLLFPSWINTPIKSVIYILLVTLAILTMLHIINCQDIKSKNN